MVDRRFLESDDAIRTLAELGEVLVEPGSRIGPEATIREVIELLLAHPHSRVAHVVGEDGKLLGTVSWRSVIKAAASRHGVREEGLLPLLRLFHHIGHDTARDLMRRPTTVTMEDTLRDALLKMERFHENDLPILDAQGRLVGEVNGTRVMRLALGAFRATEETTREAESA